MLKPEHSLLPSAHKSHTLDDTISAKPLWDPTVVLGIGQITKDFRCVGDVASSKKHQEPVRCRNCINELNREKAVKLLKDLESLNHHTDYLGDILRELAHALLCPKRKNFDHQGSQRDKQARKWQDLIDEDAMMARRDSDTIMGDTSDTTETLLEVKNDIEIRLERSRIAESFERRKRQRPIDNAEMMARRDSDVIMGEAGETTALLLKAKYEIEIRLKRQRIAERGG